MLNMTPRQIIDLWHELELAWLGKNGFGSDTAEIYVYQISSNRPAMYLNAGYLRDDAEQGAGLEAARNLYHVICLFLSKRTCDVTVNGRPFGEWLEGEVLIHRCHVRVARVKGDTE